MEWKIYEEWLDITLYRQMTNLIYKLSSNEEKYKIYMQLKENDMFLEKPKVDMETAYGLHYPGEVLEHRRTSDLDKADIPYPRTCPGKDDAFAGDLYVQWNSKGSVLEKDETDSWRERPVFDQYQLYL